MTEKPFCPECDSAHIVPIKDTRRGGTKWRCKECTERFREATHRESKRDLGSRGVSGLAKELHDAELDEL